MIKSTKGSNLTAKVTVKSQLAPDDWRKRVESRVYRRKVRNMVRVLKVLIPAARHLTADQREAAHFFLDSLSFEEVRRQRSPAERMNDVLKDVVPKDSVRY